MKTNDISRRFDRIEEEMDNLLIEVREMRQELRAMRSDAANRRCTGGSPAPARPTPPTHPSIPYTPYIRPWAPPPRITWYCDEVPVL